MSCYKWPSTLDRSKYERRRQEIVGCRIPILTSATFTRMVHDVPEVWAEPLRPLFGNIAYNKNCSYVGYFYINQLITS